MKCIWATACEDLTPFLFVMKASAPVGTKLGEICLAAVPFLIYDLIVMIILIALPEITLFLPGFMK